MSADPADFLTDSYDYALPQERIAQRPAKPADSARLLVYDRRTGTTTHTRFRDLPDFLPPEAALFLNDTRVIPARIHGRKASGGSVELLLNKALPQSRYLVMIRGKVRPGTRLYFDENLEAEVLDLLPDGTRIVRFSREEVLLDFSALVGILDRIGHIPLPPYMRRQDDASDRQDYQTLFAREAGAVAAPTASLHFTPELLETLRRKHATYTLTLHVGAGTFKPVESEHILEHPMHSEYFRIPEAAAEYLRDDAPLLAVGTTVTRTVEYFARTGKSEGECDLFLHPGNPPLRVDHLLTNFHLPKSTLLMLVSAFLGRKKTLELYAEAIEKEYRFYSYGDAMLIL
ncbi:tRNA preQ1(34) S-adenosylmethionine ribosyltransferase-isomerase QueA [Nitratifractor sp.]